MATTLISANPAQAEFHWLLRQARTPRLRSMAEFASEEFVIPKGQFKGTLVNWEIQPFARLLIGQLDTGRYPRSAVVGSVQSGKSTFGYVLEALFYALECHEPVIVSAPTMKLCRSVWRREIEPAVRASRYRQYLPSRGAGSLGGWAEEIELGNGGVFKFMSAGGGDENRSQYTARCVVMTEADKMDTAGETSRETDPVSQIENRTNSYPEELRRFHLECTVSVPEGRIWKEYLGGTASRIACPCPHCGDWVTPEREHLLGWQEADTKHAAHRMSHFACPACAERLTDADRREMNLRAVVLHRGQTIDEQGRVAGDPPETNTLGFRWNAFNNLFWSPGEIGVKEWAARHATSGEEASEKELTQFYWAFPYTSPDFDATPLDAHQVRRRFADRRYIRGVVPEDSQHLALAIDCGKRFCTWMLAACRPGCRGHIADYGTFEVPSRDQDVTTALLAALRNFRDDVILEGWTNTAGEILLPAVVAIDAGWQGGVVYEFCRDKQSGPRFRPAIGYGLSQLFRRYRSYRKPSKTGSEVKLIGEEYHVCWLPQERLFRVDFNADYWKTRLFEGLRTPPADADGKPVDGSIELYFSTDANEHVTVAKHFTAERPQEIFTPGVGSEVRWIKEKRDNHYLDVAATIGWAWHLLGARLIRKAPPPAPTKPNAPPPERPFLTPDGRPYLLSERD